VKNRFVDQFDEWRDKTKTPDSEEIGRLVRVLRWRFYAICVLPMPVSFNMSPTISHALTMVATVMVEAMPDIATVFAAVAIFKFLVWRKVVFLFIKKSKCGACNHRSR
jgi:hypothetical protein